MELTAPPSQGATDWHEMTVEELKAPAGNALATGPFGSSIGSRFFEREGVPVIRGGNLTTDGRRHLIDHGFVFVSETKAREFRRSTVRKGDLVFTSWGTINQVGLIGDDAAYERYIISNKQMKFTPDIHKADSLFLFYLFSGPELQRRIIDQSIGSSVPGFNLGQLKAMRLRLPELAEQRAIAALLRDVDSLITDMERLIGKKQAIKQGAMQQLLTGRTRLPGFDGEWTFTSLDEVASRHTGYWGTEVSIGDALRRAHIIRAGDIAPNGKLIGVAERYLTAEEFARAQCHENDVVITVSGNGLGKSWLCDGRPDTAASNFVRVLRPRVGEIDGPFLASVLRSEAAQRLLTEHTATSAYPNLRPTFFSTSWIPLPEPVEQRAIAAVLSDMDWEIDSLERRREKTTAIKQGLMQVLLTGRARLINRQTKV